MHSLSLYFTTEITWPSGGDGGDGGATNRASGCPSAARSTSTPAFVATMIWDFVAVGCEPFTRTPSGRFHFTAPSSPTIARFPDSLMKIAPAGVMIGHVLMYP